MKRYSKTLKQETTALLIIDIQDRILNAIYENERVVENALKLVKGFKTMNLPIFFTEQYPKGLGPTTSSLLKELEGHEAIEKMSFSCFGAGDLFVKLQEKDISQVVVCGVESHVCVQQTVLDLLENGFQVNLAGDAVSSRRKMDNKLALDRMRSNGAEVTSVESVLFELLEVCGTDIFKLISRIVK